MNLTDLKYFKSDADLVAAVDETLRSEGKNLVWLAETTGLSRSNWTKWVSQVHPSKQGRTLMRVYATFGARGLRTWIASERGTPIDGEPDFSDPQWQAMHKPEKLQLQIERLMQLYRDDPSERLSLVLFEIESMLDREVKLTTEDWRRIADAVETHGVRKRVRKRRRR